ncbi:MAG: hypothetical protein ACOCWM_00425 [Cyclobacteriaceae bacterium]
MIKYLLSILLLVLSFDIKAQELIWSVNLEKIKKIDSLKDKGLLVGINSIDFLDNNIFFITGARDLSLRTFDVQEKSQILNLQDEYKLIIDYDISYDKSKILILGPKTNKAKYEINIYNLQNGNIIQSFKTKLKFYGHHGFAKFENKDNNIIVYGGLKGRKNIVTKLNTQNGHKNDIFKLRDYKYFYNLNISENYDIAFFTFEGNQFYFCKTPVESINKSNIKYFGNTIWAYKHGIINNNKFYLSTDQYIYYGNSMKDIDHITTGYKIEYISTVKNYFITNDDQNNIYIINSINKKIIKLIDLSKYADEIYGPFAINEDFSQLVVSTFDDGYLKLMVFDISDLNTEI